MISSSFVDGGHDDNQTNVEDMEWEPLPDVTAPIHQVRRVHFAIDPVMSTHIVPRDRLHEIARGKVCLTSKFRAQYVFRRTNPLYWRDPMLWLKEYRAASCIVSPGRSFVSKGRALPTIREEERCIHSVMNELTNNMQRLKIVSSTESSSADIDDMIVKMQQLRMSSDDIDDLIVKMQQLRMSSDDIDDLTEKMQRLSMSSDVMDDLTDMMQRLSMGVPALRRSTRLAERRRLQQEKMELESKMMAVIALTCKNQVLVPAPHLLGSIVVNGRRRSARHLKSNVDVVA